MNRRLRGPVSALALAGGVFFSMRAEAQPRAAGGAANRLGSASAGVLSNGFLEAAPGVPAIRRERAATYGAPPPARRAAFARFTRDAGAAWQGLWDRDTDAPVRLFGAGIPAPGVVASAKVASAHARAFLAERLDLIAPRASIDQFQEVANDLDQGLRTVAFAELVPVAGRGLVPVVGGRASLRYRNDRLFMIAAETHAFGGTADRLGSASAGAGPLPSPEIDGAAAEAEASAWVAERHATATLLAGAELCALPLVGSGRREIRAAYRVEIDASAPRARYAIYVDAASGRRLAAEQLLRFEQSTVLFDAPVRAPQLGRAQFPAPLLDVTIDGAAGDTDAQGSLTWPPGPGALGLSVHGKLVHVHNNVGGDASGSFTAVSGMPVVWSMAGDELADAQLSAFIHTNIVKAHAKAIAPMLPSLDVMVPVKVNQQDPQGCNAYWDGTSLNFLQGNQSCNNTARVADVAYHEFGHAFHQAVVIPGVGSIDPSLGEGGADVMASSITHDSRIAPGFFLGGDTPLRDLASGRRWPDDISSADPHETGLIYGGAMWDLRGYLRADLGDAAGDALTDLLYFQTLRRASDIPTTYPEILAADDDDGDLSNGTPHICAINRAFVAHGLASVESEAGLTLAHEALGLVAPGDEAYPIQVKTTLLYPQCAGAPIDWVKAHLYLPDGEKSVSLSPSGSDYVGAIPGQKDGTAFRYRIEASVSGHLTTLPANRADDQYEAFAGAVEPIYCDDFEAPIEGWTFGDSKGGTGDFQWGPPTGLAGDPAAAYSGSNVIGDRLVADGAYKAGRTVFADSPVVDITGRKHVRLQFRRWLTCQDAAFDQATIYVNDQFVWQNQGTSTMDGSLAHTDLEWRFQDIDLAPYLSHGQATTAQVRFELASDVSIQRGGWNIDDFCVVASRPAQALFLNDTPLSSDPGAGAPALYLAGGCLCEGAGGGAPGGPAAMLALGLLGALGARRRRRSR